MGKVTELSEKSGYARMKGESKGKREQWAEKKGRWSLKDIKTLNRCGIREISICGRY